MGVLFDGEFPYRGYHGCRSVCRIRIFDRGPDKPYAVVATELESNRGTSITNAAEIIAEEVWKYLERPDERGMSWIEHYADRAFVGGQPMFKEQFDLVQFARMGATFHRPRWRRISKEEADTTCGVCL